MTDPFSSKFSNTKLQAMGLLTAGVAHDFNNLLAIIEGYSYILQQRIGNVPALQDKITAILNATQRGAELTQHLLEFGNDENNPASCDLVDAILHAKPILRALLSSRIEFNIQPPPGVPFMIDCSRDTVIQELIFMAARLSETIPGAGNLSLTTNITPQEAELFITNNQTGTYASKSFARIIEEKALHDKTILIVDDEEALLPILQFQLENMGLKVLKAANADSALLLQKDYPDVIDFLLTDIVMPDVDGVQLAEMISDNRPRMGVVYMTGHSSRFNKPGMPEQSLIIPKPLRTETLSQALQKALEHVKDA